MDFHIIIPARYASTRLPGKMLCDVAGKPLIQRVYEQVQKAGALSVTVATDNIKIGKVIEGIGGKVCFTDKTHSCGTERLSEAVQHLGLDDNDIVVNVQGDEPLIPPFAITTAALGLEQNLQATVATLVAPIHSETDITDPNVVKVILDHKGFALNFSRAPMPWVRDNNISVDVSKFYRHIGLYAYRVGALKSYVNWDRAWIEEMECLEQLRFLWYGEKIHATVVDDVFPGGVDTTEDLARVQETWGSHD